MDVDQETQIGPDGQRHAVDPPAAGLTAPAPAKGDEVAQGELVDRSGTIANPAVSETVMAANPARRYLFIQNPADVADAVPIKLWVRFGDDAAVVGSPSVLLAPEGMMVYEGNFVPTQAIQIIGPADADYTALEG